MYQGMRQAVIRHTFGPVADRRSRVLILGSMPGAASLAADQYYAHPRNQFWDLMGDLFGAGRGLSYAKRLARLRDRRIALWDVVNECVRSGSLDHHIDPRSVRPNDFAALFKKAPALRAVFFNGAKAAALFTCHVRNVPGIHTQTLPSTSPAHASRTYRQKRMAWSVIEDWI